VSDPSTERIRPGRLDEADALNELTKRSVMHWGYDPAFLEWEPEAITVDRPFMERAITFVLERDGVVIGYYALVEQPDGLVTQIPALIVSPWLREPSAHSVCQFDKRPNSARRENDKGQ